MELENKETEKPKSFWNKIFLGAIILFIIFCFSYLIDGFVLNGRYYNKVMYGSNCSYTVPSGFKIVYSEHDNKYAVRVLRFNDQYLYNGGHGITTMYSSITNVATFDDSCEAKAYLKAYVENQQSKMSQYK